MADTALIKDIETAVQIAREGRHAPLLGGPIGLMWTTLATVTLATHGAIVMGWLPVAQANVALIWLAYGVIGTVLSIVLSRQISGRVGANSFLNRTAGNLWCAAGLMIAAVAIATVAAYSMGRVPVLAFNFIVPSAFAFAAIAYGTLGGLTGLGYMRYAAVASGASTVATLFLVDEPLMYFVASALLFLSGVVPSFIEYRRGAA